MTNVLQSYAKLLVHYCLEIQPGERLYVRTTTLAEPLLREVYREAIEAGAHVEYDLEFRERERIFLKNAGEAQLQYVSPLYREAMETFDAYLYIRAPFNLREGRIYRPPTGNFASNHWQDYPKPISSAQQTAH
ncbi:MAG: aminopeptidase [Saprospiraceae bacterium]